ncbi:MAG: S-methyl-5'-thioinosine phosphorylase [Woeseiaceae bacterium]|nr:S-methyl-5'-thioinosine phosphorylase [Woeseiaceae bacterium]
MPDTHAIIVGSGFDGFIEDTPGEMIATPYGEPSAALRKMSMGRHDVVVLPRHGDEHSLPPHAINYRANMAALSQLQVDSVIALNTVGVITHVCEPGQLALPDQLLDYTWGRAHTIYDGGGQVEHIDFTEPFSSRLRSALVDAAMRAGIACHAGGVYATTQGPRLETAAEIDRLQRDGADFVGMTAMPEAALARELGLEYACLALIVNRAAGRGDVPIHDDVEASTVEARLQATRTLKQYFDA